MSDRHAAQYQSYIVDQLRASTRETSSERFTQSLDIVLGKNRIYVQKSRLHYFPALPTGEHYSTNRQNPRPSVRSN